MPLCSRCNKAVYPLEELKCLDKVWHKGCFKCSECGMTLNMKTYKGFNKLPYCEAHIPKAKATTVADTPEFKRIQENTKIQSNAAYHAEFEKSKGKFTPIVDDPELLRIKLNTKIISNVAYHGDLEKKALMEQKRILNNESRDDTKNGLSPPKSPSYMDELASLPTPQPAAAIHQSQQKRHYQPPQYNPPPAAHSTNMQYRNNPNNYVADDPVSRHTHPYNQGLANSPYSTRGAPNVIYSSDVGAVSAGSPRKVGSIADYDPVNNYYGSLDPQRSGHSGRMTSGYAHPQQSQYHPQQHHQQQQPLQQQPLQQQQQQPYRNSSQQPNYGVCYRALYDYEAQDNDEISFADGDLIIECTAVEEGWMTGTVQRTGSRGMLPANYVTPA